MISFSYTHSIETDAPATTIWSLYEDVTTWPSWDADAEVITRDGPFAAGSTGTMKFRGQDTLAYTLTKVEPLREWIDETPVGDIVVRVSHRLDPEAMATGIGAAITADFPATMESLIALAKERSR